ncbi:MAG: HAD family hydrolase [Nitrososphaeria archaeon]
MATIFLDLGGTLVDFRPTYHEPIYTVLLKNGYDVSLRDVYRAVSKYLGNERLPVVNGNPVIDVNEVLRIIGISVDSRTLEELRTIEFVSIWYTLYHDTLPFLKALKRMGYRIFLISNASEKINRVISETGISAYLDGIVASYRVGKIKPSADIFEEGIRLAGERGLYVGDLYEVDYLGSMKAGLSPVLLDRLGFYDDVQAVKVRSLLDVLRLLGR